MITIERPIAFPYALNQLNSVHKDIVESYVQSLEKEVDILQTELLDMSLNRAFCSIKHMKED